jgi:hypothetical protein
MRCLLLSIHTRTLKKAHGSRRAELDEWWDDKCNRDVLYYSAEEDLWSSDTDLISSAGTTCVPKARLVYIRHFVTPSGVQDQKDTHEGANRGDERVIQVLGEAQGEAEAT